MNLRLPAHPGPLAMAVAVFLTLPVASTQAGAEISGITGTTFNFTARADFSDDINRQGIGVDLDTLQYPVDKAADFVADNSLFRNGSGRVFQGCRRTFDDDITAG